MIPAHYTADPDGRHWHYRCPLCGRTGRSQGYARIVGNYRAHRRYYHR